MPSTARDCMSAHVKSVSPEMNAREALKFLLESGVSGLPVIDGAGKLLGVFTEKEVLKAVLPGYLKDVGDFVYGGEAKAGLKKLAHLDKFMVRDVMRAEITTVKEDASVAEVSRLMIAKSERRVMVVRDGRTVGVITRADVVKALAKEAGVEL